MGEEGRSKRWEEEGGKDEALIEGRRKDVYLSLCFFEIILSGFIILPGSVCW